MVVLLHYILKCQIFFLISIHSFLHQTRPLIINLKHQEILSFFIDVETKDITRTQNH